MPHIARDLVGSAADSFGAVISRFCPPDPAAYDGVGEWSDGRREGGALATWLSYITPAGAPVVPITRTPQAPTIGGEPVPEGPRLGTNKPDRVAVEIPYAAGVGAWGTVPFLADHAPRPSGGRGWQDLSQRDRDAEILKLVPRGVQRPSRGEGVQRQAGIERWSMETAFFVDVAGATRVRAAGFTGHAAIDRGETETRSTDRWLKRGREILARIGAWPWCLADDGKLPNQWWLQEAFRQELADWHEEATVRAINDALRAIQYAAGDRTITPTTAANVELARTIYAQQFTDTPPSEPDAPFQHREYAHFADLQQRWNAYNKPTTVRPPTRARHRHRDQASGRHIA